MRLSWIIITTVVWGWIGVSPVRGDPARARELLELSAEALKNVQTLTADVEVGATEGFANYLPHAKGRLIVGRIAEDGSQPARRANPFEFRFTGKGRVTGNADEIEFDVIYRDRRFEWMNDEQKEQRIRFERIAGRDNEVRLAKSFLLDHLFGADPLAAELKSENMEMVESKTIDGQSCDGVKIPQGKTGRYMIIYIPRSDFIPRRIEQGIDMANSPISGTEYKQLTNVRVNEPLPDSAFEMPIPPGYSADPNPARAIRPAQPPQTQVNPDATPRRPLATPFELSDGDGNTVRLQDLRGKVVVLDFWGTWLPESARQGMGVMQQVHEHFGDGDVLCFGVNFRERDPEKAKAFFKDGGFTYGVLLGGDKVARSYGVRQFPTIYIIGKEGEIVEVVNGYKEGVTEQHVIKAIEDYLAEDNTPGTTNAPTTQIPSAPAGAGGASGGGG